MRVRYIAYAGKIDEPILIAEPDIFQAIIFKTMITNKENITKLCLHWR